jgi:glutamyl-tRNA synthetase
MGGEFILRIEDTDLERSKKEYLDEILESINWLGMDWDSIFYQSKRFELYREYADKLIKKGLAYEKEGAIFFKYEFERIEVDDLIRGKISFDELPKLEEVIIKSDGSPAYNFSCAIDDATMEISCVIRGEDHLSNTPKQILMYKALGFAIPKFAHLPLILSPGGGRLSKRFGATSIREYRNLGYLPEAIINYLLLLGWSPKENVEIISVVEAEKIFEVKDVNKSGAAFSLDKLNWMNSQYIKEKTSQELADLFEPQLKRVKFLPEKADKQYLVKVINLFKERISNPLELVDKARSLYYDDFTYDEDAKEILAKNLSKEVKLLIDRFAKINEFNKEIIEKEFRAAVSESGLKLRDLIHPTRVALTGKKTGAGLFETLEVLGRERAIERLERLLKYWK